MVSLPQVLEYADFSNMWREGDLYKQMCGSGESVGGDGKGEGCGHKGQC